MKKAFSCSYGNDSNHKFESFVFANFTYLHGALENWIGSDLFYWFENPETGVYPVELTNADNGETKIAIAYVWIGEYDRPCGLLVDPNDFKSVKYAMEKYGTKNGL